MGRLHTEARRLERWGYRVLPADKVKKVPALWLVGEPKQWKRWQEEDTGPYLLRWFGKDNAKIALCVLTGAPSGMVVLDIDSPAAYDAWVQEIGQEALEQTAYVRTQSYEAKGGGGVGHYHFKLPPGGRIRNSGQSKDEADRGVLWDFRGDGGHVVVPPSAGYQWIRTPDQAIEAPKTLLDAVERKRGERNAGADGGAGGVHSTLAGLLNRPPEGEGSGRNNWLTQVAGHYAKAIRFKDAFEAQVRMANQALIEPLPDNEVDKMIESIWASEMAKGTNQEELCTADRGWLAHGSSELYVQCRVKEEDRFEIRFEEWADFNIEALGVVEDEEARRTYDVLVHRKRQGDVRRDQLPASVLSDPRRLKVWLGEHGVTVSQPDQAWPKMTWEVRLARWIEDQRPPHYQVVHSLGWHGEGFITHNGVITAEGLQDYGTHRPDPSLIGYAPYHYGFGKDAIAVLREVLTYHHERVAAVFGAWWAAALLKPQIAAMSSLFPFMALEAPSESGKTTGYFSLMLALSGNREGQVVATKASLRDMVGAHQSGIVWVDDMDSIQGITEVLRAATGDGTLIKKGEDNTSQVKSHLVAPVVVSGEALSLGHQKALMDRCVSLDVPPPTQRMSLHSPGRKQWDDILDLRRRCPDLSIYAGTIVVEMLKRAWMVESIADLRPPDGGRWADKIAIVRLGARILADVTGDRWLVTETDAWASTQVNLGDENTLTLKLLPEALRMTDFPYQPIPPHGHWPVSPVLVRDGVVWFSPEALSTWWKVQNHGRIEERTESSGALSQQAHVLGLGGPGGRKAIKSLSGQAVKYWRCTDELSDVIIERARGGNRQPVTEPVTGPVTGDRISPRLESWGLEAHFERGPG